MIGLSIEVINQNLYLNKTNEIIMGEIFYVYKLKLIWKMNEPKVDLSHYQNALSR